MHLKRSSANEPVVTLPLPLQCRGIQVPHSNGKVRDRQVSPVSLREFWFVKPLSLIGMELNSFNPFSIVTLSDFFLWSLFCLGVTVLIARSVQSGADRHLPGRISYSTSQCIFPHSYARH